MTLLIGMGRAAAAEKTDSLSYAYGYQYTIATMAGKNDMMQNEQDLRDYIRGLEEKDPDLIQMNDSSYMISYLIGATEAVFMTDGVHHKKKEDLPPFSCIITGLRKVGEKKICLPADTVAAMSVINRYSEDEMKPEDFDADVSCRFYTAYGIMKAYQPGLQQYIEGLLPGTSCIENRQAFATGMADILEAYTVPPATAYDMGRSIALTMRLTSLEKDPVVYTSFVAGAKASLGLGEQIIPRNEVDEIFNRQFEQQLETSDKIDNEAYFEKVADYIEKLEIEPFTQYQVDWKVTAGTVADSGTAPTDVFSTVISELNVSDDALDGILMAQLCDEDSPLCETALTTIKRYSLPDGYKWFCGRNVDGQTTIGIMQTVGLFKADAHKASVYMDRMSGMVNVEWEFDVKDALKWAEFTTANIGRHVAMEIDGVFMFAPKVNQQISGGRCSISSLTPEEINRLFKNAKKEENQTPVDTIEVIEIN